MKAERHPQKNKNKMKTKETLHKKFIKYQNWIMYPAYIEQEIKGYRLMDKLIEEITK